MNKLVLIALVACAGIALSEATKMSDREGYKYDGRPRLGHFKEGKTMDLYKYYAVAFVKDNFQRSDDDYRNYMPSGAECVEFLRRFVIDEYNLRGVEEMVILDACLGYLYESTYHEQDKAEDYNVKDNLDGLIEDQNLRDLYQNTQFESSSDEAKICIGNLLYDSIKAKKQYPDVVCNNFWIKLLNDFAACARTAIPENRHSDSYSNIIFKTVKDRGVECFNNELNLINTAVRQNYVNSPFQIASNTLSFWNKLKGQSAERLWGKELRELLVAVQNAKKQVNLREVANIVRAVTINDEQAKVRILRNMAEWATKKIKPQRQGKEAAADPTGARRYTDAVDKLCYFFRSANSERFYDFATVVKRMVEMLKYPEVFGITEQKFAENMIIHGHETTPLYLAVTACNVLLYTEGVLDVQTPNHTPEYKVVFKRDMSKMVRWPDVGYY